VCRLYRILADIFGPSGRVVHLTRGELVSLWVVMRKTERAMRKNAYSKKMVELSIRLL
jgi:hypothetical protein